MVRYVLRLLWLDDAMVLINGRFHEAFMCSQATIWHDVPHQLGNKRQFGDNFMSIYLENSEKRLAHLLNYHSLFIMLCSLVILMVDIGHLMLSRSWEEG